MKIDQIEFKKSAIFIVKDYLKMFHQTQITRCEEAYSLNYS
jgi:hypothetical protein